MAASHNVNNRDMGNATDHGPVWTLHVPPVHGPLQSRDGDVALVLEAADRLFDTAEQCIGLELKTAYALLKVEGAYDLLAHNPARFAHLAVERSNDQPPIRRQLLRAAVEPILLSWWPEISSLSFAPREIEALASTLAGKRVGTSRRRMRTRGDKAGHILYADLPSAMRWRRYIATANQRCEDPVARAIYIYAVVVICHPLTDANGRLARALLLGSLARDGVIRHPSLPLGPIFYRNADLIFCLFRRLATDGKWLAFIDDFSEVLIAAAHAACEDRIRR